MSIVTSKLCRGTGWCWCVAHVLQLVRLITTVVVPIADKVTGHAAAILAGELVLLAGLVGAALLITAIPAVITTITPDFRRSQKFTQISRWTDDRCNLSYFIKFLL